MLRDDAVGLALGTLLTQEGWTSLQSAFEMRRFLRLEKSAPRAVELFGWSDLNRMLFGQQFATEQIGLWRDARSLPRDQFLNESGHVKSRELLAALRAGATLSVNGVHTLSRRLSGVARELADAFREDVQINLYASWHASPGFPVHWDVHDVLVLQLDGEKDWEVFGSTTEDPVLDGDLRTEAPPPTHEPCWKGVLLPGDVLYMPRGCWHSAVAREKPSLHLTIGISRVTGLDFVRWLAGDLMAHRAFRRDIRDQMTESNTAKYLDELRTAAATCITAEALTRFLAWRDARYVTRRALSLPHGVLDEEERMISSTVVEMVVARAVVSRSLAGGGSLTVSGRHYGLDSVGTHVVEFLVRKRRALFSDILALPSAAGFAQEVSALIRLLVREGLIVLYND